MEVKKGYKQTELGVIPEDWEVKNISEIAQVVGGGTPSTSNKSYWGGIINWFTPTEVGKTKYLYNSIRKITPKGLEESSAIMLEKGTILLTSRAGIGDLGILHTRASTNQGFQSLCVNDQVSNEFIYYLMLTKKHILLKNASGSTFLEISPSKVKQILIPIPPLPEQKAIATALSDMDALIAQTEKFIDKKKAMKQGMMQELLKPKKGWVTKKLGEICEIIGGGTPSTTNSSFWNGDINWFTPTEVGQDKFLYTSMRKITSLGLAACSARILPAGTILLTTRAGIGDLGILIFDAATNQGFQSLLPRAGVHYEFVYYMMQTKKSELLQNASGSTFLEISPRKLKSIEISIPSITIQKEIAGILQEIDSTISLIETKLQKLKLQKQGMMQELLTGRIRLL